MDLPTEEDLRYLTPEERAELDLLLSTDDVVWRPLPGPQLEAAVSQADIVGFGGSAGGGKTDLACGLSTTEHERAAIFRLTGTELVAIRERLAELLPDGNYNSRDNIFRFERHGRACSVELGAFPDLGDERKYQGRPHDLLVFDEAANMRESQVRFLLGWLRSVSDTQRKRVLMTFNPPTTVEGRWIIQFFAPWLDDKHPNPAVPGELRWFATVSGVDLEVPDSRRFVLGEDKRTRIYDFDPDAYSADDIIEPMSRTFIPSRIADNPFLFSTGYMRTLQALPEPLRSQLLKGDFRAGVKDDAFQVIPTAWVEAAMARWSKPHVLAPMDSIGADIAMGGADEHVVIARHGNWFSELTVSPGEDIDSAARSGAEIIACMRDQAVLHIDLFGVGAKTYGFLMAAQLQAVGVNMGDTTKEVDATGRLRFANVRSLLWWRMREALDPESNRGIALPPDRGLLRDLCTPKWSMPNQVIKVQSRDEIIKVTGRSPDRGTAAILALMGTPKRRFIRDIVGRQKRSDGGGQDRPYDPFAFLSDT